MIRGSDEDARRALAEYERWRYARGLPPESRWRNALTKAGLALPDPPEFEKGDAAED